MKITIKQYAQSLYESLAEIESEVDVKVALNNFVKLLSARRSLNKTGKIIAEFEKIWNREQGIVEGELVSAKKLDNGIIELLNCHIVKLLSIKEVNLANQIDKNILGGFIVKVGDTVIDGSVKNQLNNLKNKLIL
ncbi:ATP synthase F1 subunit delta [Candidatus Falkowbacteria bacterium RIFOXYA2_FULL_47_9]|uniref:ATP synthase subunit delta n=1 Tax=Candidatus Falkowbacteria bacterium RIFOXYA2_FULL_47_9 TaxID=1797995 RepID=A0A1F5SPR4_9BACT|nr:MAG: ATP synthase F1 subunit delta [Candidatus Falkowbacteria bacterium RIFOXYA2_FULL_47_9]